jgi:PQQ-like domain
MRRSLLALSLLLTACGASSSAGEDHDAGSAAHDGAAPEGAAATDAGADATHGEGGASGKDGGANDGGVSADGSVSAEGAASDGGDASTSPDAAGTGDAATADANGTEAGTSGEAGGVTSAGCTQGAGVQAGAPWPMVERCPTREGFGAATSLAAPAAVTWTQSLNGLLATAPTIAADGTIYVGGLDFYALNPNGTQKWAALVGHPVGSATIAADGTVVVVTADETLRAYNPDGTSKWTYAFGGSDDSTGSPAIAADGTIYFATSLMLYSVSSAGALNWSQSNGYRSNPVVAGDGTVYIADGLDDLLAIHPTGVGAWTYKAAGLCNGDPIVGADGRIYFAANPGLNANEGDVYAMNPDGTNAWTASPPIFVDRIGMGPDGTIYFQGLDDSIRQVTSAGSLGWTHTLKYPAPCGTFAVAGDGTIYVTCGDNVDAPPSVEAIRPDGTTAWTLDLLTTQLAYSYPAIGADGTLYFGWKTLMAIEP